MPRAKSNLRAPTSERQKKTKPQVLVRLTKPVPALTTEFYFSLDAFAYPVENRNPDAAEKAKRVEARPSGRRWVLAGKTALPGISFYPPVPGGSHRLPAGRSQPIR
jgi:hypothetical protein